MLSSSLYLFVSKVIGYGFRIILPVFLVRILVKEDFGAYNQFFLLEILIHSLFQAGISHALFFFVPRDQENSGAYFLNSIVLGSLFFTISYAVLWVFRMEVAEQLGMQIIHLYFWHLAAYSLLMMFNVAVYTYLSARQKIFQASIFNILRELLASIATLGVAYYTRDLEKIFLALIASRCITLIFGLAYVHFGMNGFRAQKYFFGLKEQIRYIVVLGLGATLGTLTMRFHEMTVTRYFDIETFAVYAAGCKQIPILQFFGQSISAVALSQFALLEKSGDWDGIRKLWNKILGALYGVGIPTTFFLLLISKPLVTLMFTDSYADAVPIFRFNALAMLSLMLNSTLVLRAMNRNDITLKVNATMLIVLPVALYGGMKLFGLTGIIATHAIFLLGNRVVAHATLNRLSPVYLPYIASRKSVEDFYVSSFSKAKSLLGKRPSGYV